MADTTYTLAVDTLQAQRNLDNLNTKLKTLNDTFGKFRNVLAGLALGGLVKEVNSFALAMDQVAKSTGVSLDTINSFSDAVGGLGGNSSKAVGDVQDFVAGLYDAKNGSAGAQAELAKIGITLQDLATLSNEDIFKKTIQGLAQIESATTRNALAVKMLGKNFKDIDVRSVASAMGAGGGGGGASAAAITAAADAQRAMIQNLDNLKNALLEVIKPLNQIVAGINVSKDAFESLIKVVVYATGVWLAFAKVLPMITGAANGVIAFFSGAGGLLATLTGVIAKAFSELKGFILLWYRFLFVGGGATSVINAITGSLALLARAFTRLLGVVGIVFTIAEAVNFLSKQFFEFDIIDAITDKVKKLYNAAKEYFGLGDSKPEFLSQEEVDREMKMLQARQQMTQATEKVIDANRGVALELQKQVQLYQQSGVELKRKLQFENSLIGMSEAQKTKVQALFDVESDYLKQVTDLKQKYVDMQAAAATGTDEEKAKFAAFSAGYADTLKKINQEYQNQKNTVSKLTDETLKLTQAEKLRVFGVEQQNSLVTQLISLQDQINTTLLPEMEKRYYAVEAAAKSAALAQIQAEEIRMGRKLTPDEAKAYYDTASKGVDQLKSKQAELLAVQEKLNLRTFSNAQEFQNKEKLIELNDELAKLTLPTLEKKYYDIEAAAKASARAEIQAAEARLGRKLSAEEAQQYFDAASKGTDQLKQKTQELYDASRSFETGWKQAFNSYVEDATNAATRAGDIFNSVTRNMDAALDNFVETGKLSFKDLANSIIKDILKIELKAAAANLWKAMGSGSGGLFGGSIIPGFLADGGPAQAGKPYIVGEQGPELFVPKGSGTVIPNGASMNGQVTNHYTYNISAVDAQSVARLFTNNRQLLLGATEQARKELPMRTGARR